MTALWSFGGITGELFANGNFFLAFYLSSAVTSSFASYAAKARWLAAPHCLHPGGHSRRDRGRFSVSSTAYRLWAPAVPSCR